MADVQIESATMGEVNETHMPRCFVWTDPSTAYIFYIAADDDLEYRKTTNGGTSWATPVTIRTGTVENISVWFDKWTEGDSGTIIHLAYADSAIDDTLYNSLDTSDDSLSGEVQVNSTAAFTSTDNWGTKFVDITKAIGGNLYIVDRGHFGVDINFYRSTDGGSTWTGRTTPDEGANADRGIILPANEADTQDIYMVFLDDTAVALTVKVYDDSANSWSEGTGSITLTSEDGTHWQFDAVKRHSDNHIILVAWNDTGSSTGDIICYDITDKDTFTAKTDVITNSASGGISIMINQQNDDLYVAYMNPNSTWTLTVDCVYKKSTDGGSNWGTETAMSADTADDLRWITAGHMVLNAGGKFQPVWFNDDLTDLLTNTDNGISINSLIIDSTLTSGGSDTNTDTFTTASITPGADQLILAAFVGHRIGSASDMGTVTASGNGLTWVEIANDITADGDLRITLFRAMGSSPSSGTVTFTCSNSASNAEWSIVQFDNVDTSGTNGSGAIVQSAKNKASSGTSLTVTLGAFSDANNATYGAFGIQANETHTPGSGFTELHDQASPTEAGSVGTQWRAENDTTVDMSWTSSVNNAGIAVEIKPAGAAAAATDPVSWKTLLGAGVGVFILTLLYSLTNLG